MNPEQIKQRLRELGCRIAPDSKYEPRYQCTGCKDTGFLLETDDQGAVLSIPCGDCLKGAQRLEAVNNPVPLKERSDRAREKLAQYDPDASPGQPGMKRLM